MVKSRKYIIEKYPCNDKNKQLTEREQFFINIFNPKFNTATAKSDINDYNYYHNSYIYKFINKINGELLYIGSSNNDIINRIGNHKSHIRNPEKIKNKNVDDDDDDDDDYNDNDKQIYNTLKNIGIENIEFYVMNKLKCENEYELHEIENQYIKYYNPILNTQRSKPQQEYKNDDLIDINTIVNRKNFPSIKYMCKCGLYYTRNSIFPIPRFFNVLYIFSSL